MAKTKFEVGKEYKTRDGSPAKVFMIADDSAMPIIGALLCPVDKCWVPTSWRLDGRGYVSRIDLMPHDPIRHVGWINVYSGGGGYIHPSQDAAAHDRAATCIACVRVEYVDGEGL